jgi:hypothetical protein
MSEKPANPMSRRQFARRAAIASAVASLAPAAAMSVEFEAGVTQSLLPGGQTPPSSTQAQLPANMPKLSPESQAEADARFQSILAEYPSRFSDVQKADLRRLCSVVQAPLDRLRTYKVENGDGPGVYLKPLLEREKKPKAVAVPAPPAAKASVAATKP